jgi:hypothetical protein
MIMLFAAFLLCLSLTKRAVPCYGPSVAVLGLRWKVGRFEFWFVVYERDELIACVVRTFDRATRGIC